MCHCSHVEPDEGTDAATSEWIVDGWIVLMVNWLAGEGSNLVLTRNPEPKVENNIIGPLSATFSFLLVFQNKTYLFPLSYTIPKLISINLIGTNY